MPQCAQCQTSDTPCWREGPQGARTLCNACGIRWKRLMGRNKRSTKRSTTPKSKPAKKKQQPQPQQQVKVETPIQKPQQPIVARTTRSNTRTTRKLLDHSTLASKSVLTMSQNELLDCILTRLEDLESSQTRTSLRVRVLTQRLMRQKQKQNNTTSSVSRARPRTTFSADMSSKLQNSSLMPRQEVEVIEGNGEAALLASMREGTSISLPVEFSALQTFS